MRSQAKLTQPLPKLAVMLVHKGCTLVGWYTLAARTGPTSSIMPIHNIVRSSNIESPLLLAFHPDEAGDPSAPDRLPFTVYESVDTDGDTAKEAVSGTEAVPGADGEDQEMTDGDNATPAAPASRQSSKVRLYELPYSVETSDAEMISMDFVARGAANAAAVESREKKAPAVEGDAKGKRRVIEAETPAPLEDVLSREDMELVSTLTTKANAIKMLHSRIELIIKYLENLPPSYLSGDGQAAAAQEQQAGQQYTTPSNTILRSIQALVNRLDLVNQSVTETFKEESLSEANNVHLVTLLGDIMESVGQIREVGRKFSIVDAIRHSKNPSRGNDFGPSTSAFSITGAGDIMA